MRLKETVKNILKQLGIKKDTLIQNINLDCTKQQKKVLIGYLDYIIASESVRKSPTHSNQIRYMQIIKAFIDLNYVIDTCQFNDKTAIQRINFSEYDIILSFGLLFDEACKSKTHAIKIIYMTEAPYRIAFDAEKRRIEYFKERHHRNPPQNSLRAGMYYTIDQEKKADIVMFQGEKKHYQNLNLPLFQVYPNAFLNENFKIDEIFERKDSTKFIVFGVSNNWIRKGIDLLFEIFSTHPELTLYLCDKNLKKQACALGYKTFPPNIINCGFVSYKSEVFLNLFYECAYILLPSCFEGMPSAILTGMCHGTIPIVCHNIGLDEFADYCMYFRNDSLQEIERTIIKAASESHVQVLNQCKKIYTFANNKFTLKNFYDNFYKFLINLSSN